MVSSVFCLVYVLFQHGIVDFFSSFGIFFFQKSAQAAGLGPRTERDGSIAYYLSEPVVDDDVKAVGVLMMVTAELMKMD